MLIPMPTVMDLWNPTYPPRITHAGAHRAEERVAYETAQAEWVLWVEGNPELLDGLNAHLTEPRTPTRTQHQVAHAVLGPVDGKYVTLNVSDETLNSSVLEEGTIPVGETRPYKTTATTVDALTFAYGQPTMLNLDLQGAELAALHGAVGTLPGVELVYCEVSEVETYKGVPHWREVDAFLASQGFRLAQIEMDRNGAGWGDMVQIREGCG